MNPIFIIVILFLYWLTNCNKITPEIILINLYFIFIKHFNV